MTDPLRRIATAADFSRRRFARLATLGIAAGAAPVRKTAAPHTCC